MSALGQEPLGLGSRNPSPSSGWGWGGLGLSLQGQVLATSPLPKSRGWKARQGPGCPDSFVSLSLCLCHQSFSHSTHEMVSLLPSFPHKAQVPGQREGPEDSRQHPGPKPGGCPMQRA